ncbi:PREDICTED: C-C motif chemokine 20-like [Nanorana parkeri]|uniref:C-C motif chemokine 20-like n=1 Tax=Nanorana parkeri TaxID=125878 RepID=UPI0008540377|nr:PREDICTED: C-C motif chemokine 20-like [Nanorana parkeri]
MSRASSAFCILCILLLGLQTLTHAAVFDCCYAYTKKPLSRKVVKGHMIQNSHEVCDIDAVILITKKFRVCANPREAWVNKLVSALKRKTTMREEQPKKNSNVLANQA